VHFWLYATALAVLNFVSPDECVELLHEYIPRKPKPGNEVELQVAAALQTKESGQTVSFNRRPEFPVDTNSPRNVLEIAAAGIGIEHLRSLSPERHHRDIASADVLKILFPNDPLICAGQYFGRPFTAHLSEFHPRFLSRCSFVVPNPKWLIRARCPNTAGSMPQT
jgi:hypothetical protein